MRTTQDLSAESYPVPEVNRSTQSRKEALLQDSESGIPGWAILASTNNNRYDWVLHDDQVQLVTGSGNKIIGKASAEVGMIFSNVTKRFQRNTTVPRSILCATIVQLRDVAHVCLKPFRIDWIDLKGGQRVCNEITAFIQSQTIEGERIFKTAGTIRLLELDDSTFAEVDACDFESEQDRDWAKFVPSMVARHCGNIENGSPFFIVAQVMYDTIKIHHNKSDCASNIRTTLAENQRKNLHGQAYWSKKVINTIFTKETVTQLVNEDQLWKQKFVVRKKRALEPEDCERFIDFVLNERVRILAVSLFSHMTLEVLVQMFLNQRRTPQGPKYPTQDQNIPLPEEELKLLLDDKFSVDCFLKCQSGFHPWGLPKKDDMGSKTTILDNDIVVPIETTFKLGEGASGSVYNARVHGDYHAYAVDKNQDFALKAVDPRWVHDDIQKESIVLHKISRLPHNHITPFHVAWVQDGKAFILLPKADCDLSAVLHRPAPDDLDISDKKVCWLITQLYGLAAALAHIHNIGRASLSSEKPTIGLNAGYHHDLRPQNILVFPQQTWKISDFGSAKIQDLKSGPYKSGSPHTPGFAGGDEIYGGPDIHMKDKNGQRCTSGRRYDIWSLGCIFTEVLVWAFPTSSPKVKLQHEDRESRARAFARLRTNCKPGPCNCTRASRNAQKSPDIKPHIDKDSDESDDNMKGTEIPNFWYRCDAEKCHLKCIVSNVLKDLRESWKEKRRFLKPLCGLIKRMLSLHPDERPAASTVADELADIWHRAQVALHEDNKILDQDGRIKVEIASSFGDDVDNASRSTSHDRKHARYLNPGNSQDLSGPRLNIADNGSPKRSRSSSQSGAFRGIGSGALVFETQDEAEPSRKRSRSATDLPPPPRLVVTDCDISQSNRHGPSSDTTGARYTPRSQDGGISQAQSPVETPSPGNLSSSVTDLEGLEFSRLESITDAVSQADAEFPPSAQELADNTPAES